MYPNGYLCHHPPQASCKDKDFNSRSWHWITQNCSPKVSEIFTSAWTLVPAKVKLSLMRKILLINYFYELLYSSKPISFFIYSLQHWLRVLQFSVLFLIIVVFHFANQKVCLHRSVTSLNGHRQHAVLWEKIAYKQEKLKLLNSSFNIS